MKRVVLYLAVLTIGIVCVGSSLLFVDAIGTTCRQTQRTWDSLHRVIASAYSAPPGFHLDAQMRDAIRHARDRAEQAQGPRPTC